MSSLLKRAAIQVIEAWDMDLSEVEMEAAIRALGEALSASAGVEKAKDDFIRGLVTERDELREQLRFKMPGDWAGLSVAYSEELIAQYEGRPLELLEAAEAYLRGRNT